MNLWEGNVLGHVCLSLYPESHETITYDELGLPVQPLSIPSRQGISLYMDLSAWASPVHGIPLYKPIPQLVTSGGQDWRPV